MTVTKSDWLVYNLNLLFGQGFYPRSRAGLIFRQAAERHATGINNQGQVVGYSSTAGSALFGAIN